MGSSGPSPAPAGCPGGFKIHKEGNSAASGQPVPGLAPVPAC